MKQLVQQMINFIETNVKNEFSLNALAYHVGYSPYYCSFKFHQMTGISMRRYILQRRLYLSAQELKHQRRILAIALDYGYSSQEAYSRAFKDLFGMSPGEFQRVQMPIQSFQKLTLIQEKGGQVMNVAREEVMRLQHENRQLFDQDVLNILNGQHMYEEFQEKKLMGESDYVPFNEAMCVNTTTYPIFDEQFTRVRAFGHGVTADAYKEKVIYPLNSLFNKDYRYIVLWFGEDVFCQMNLITILAYLEEAQYKGRVYLNNFRENEFQVNQMELTLGNFRTIFQNVLIDSEKSSVDLLPVMYQAIDLHLMMQSENNEVTKYIKQHPELSAQQLLKELFQLFSTLGYGDTQYLEIIRKVRG